MMKDDREAGVLGHKELSATELLNCNNSFFPRNGEDSRAVIVRTCPPVSLRPVYFICMQFPLIT